MESAQMIRCLIWTLPFDKTRFSQFNTVSADIVPHHRFFSVRAKEIPEVIALDYVLVALNFPLKFCVFAFQIGCAEFAANGFIRKSSCFKPAISALSFSIRLFAASNATVHSGRPVRA